MVVRTCFWFSCMRSQRRSDLNSNIVLNGVGGLYWPSRWGYPHDMAVAIKAEPHL